MTIALEVLKDVRVATPCTFPWERMTGDEHVRHCPECRLDVYNFSAMTAEEVTRLIESRDGQLCGRFYRRADGTMITRDCPVGLTAPVRRRVAGLAARVAAVALLAAGAVAFVRSGPAKRDTRVTVVKRVEPIASIRRWLNPPPTPPPVRVPTVMGIIRAPPRTPAPPSAPAGSK